MASEDRLRMGVAADGSGAETKPGPRHASSRRIYIVALAAGLLLRLWFIFQHAYVSGDSLLYGDLARNLLEHHVYGISQTLNGIPIAPHPTLIRLPGYPLFLALCFRLFGVGHYTAVMLVQALVDLWTCVLMAALTRLLFGMRAGLVALWLAVLCPFTANYVAAPLTETVTLFCIALVFFSLARWNAAMGGTSDTGLNRWLGPLAFGLAFAILLRPEQGLLAAAVIPAMLWMILRAKGVHRSWRIWTPVVLTALLTLLPLAPWAARNWHEFHVFQPLAPRFAVDPGEPNPDGFQRWYRTWAIDFTSTDNVYWSYDGAAIQLVDLPKRAFDSSAQFAATRAVLAEYNEKEQPTALLDERFAALAAARVRASPMRYYLVLPVARVVNMMLRPRTEMLPVSLEWWKFREHLNESVFALVYAALNLSYFGLATATLIRRRVWSAHQPMVWSMIAMLGLRGALLLTLDNSEPRYTLEFFPVLIVFAAATLARGPGGAGVDRSAA